MTAPLATAWASAVELRLGLHIGEYVPDGDAAGLWDTATWDVDLWGTGAATDPDNPDAIWQWLNCDIQQLSTHRGKASWSNQYDVGSLTATLYNVAGVYDLDFDNPGLNVSLDIGRLIRLEARPAEPLPPKLVFDGSSYLSTPDVNLLSSDEAHLYQAAAWSFNEIFGSAAHAAAPPGASRWGDMGHRLTFDAGRGDGYDRTAGTSHRSPAASGEVHTVVFYVLGHAGNEAHLRVIQRTADNAQQSTIVGPKVPLPDGEVLRLAYDFTFDLVGMVEAEYRVNFTDVDDGQALWVLDAFMTDSRWTGPDLPSLDIDGTVTEDNPAGAPVAYTKGDTLKIGENWTGELTRYVRRDGTAGPVVADLDTARLSLLTGPLPDGTKFTDAMGREWTTHGTVSVDSPQVAWTPVFTGQVTGLAETMNPAGVATVTVSAADAFSYLGRFTFIAESSDPPTEPAADRIARILDKAAWPDIRRDLDAGDGVDLAPSTLATNALGELKLAAESAGGDVYVDTRGRIAYRPRRDPTAVPVVGILTGERGASADPDTDPPILCLSEPLTLSRGIDRVANTVDLTSPAGNATVHDPISQQRYGPRFHTRTNLVTDQAGDLDSLAASILVRARHARTRLDAAAVDIVTRDDAAWILARRFGEPIRLIYRHPIHGWTVDLESTIIGIDHRVTDAAWFAVFITDALPTTT